MNRGLADRPETGTVVADPRQRFAGELWKLADLEQAASSRRSFRARAYRAAV